MSWKKIIAAGGAGEPQVPSIKTLDETARVQQAALWALNNHAEELGEHLDRRATGSPGTTGAGASRHLEGLRGHLEGLGLGRSRDGRIPLSAFDQYDSTSGSLVPSRPRPTEFDGEDAARAAAEWAVTNKPEEVGLHLENTDGVRDHEHLRGLRSTLGI